MPSRDPSRSSGRRQPRQLAEAAPDQLGRAGHDSRPEENQRQRDPGGRAGGYSDVKKMRSVPERSTVTGNFRTPATRERAGGGPRITDRSCRCSGSPRRYPGTTRAARSSRSTQVDDVGRWPSDERELQEQHEALASSSRTTSVLLLALASAATCDGTPPAGEMESARAKST